MTYFWACNCSFISCKCGSGVLFYHTYSFIDSFIQWFIDSFSSIYFTVLRNTTQNSRSVYLLSNHAGGTYTLHSSTGPISSFRYTRSLVQVTLNQHSARRKRKNILEHLQRQWLVSGQGRSCGWLMTVHTVVRDARRLAICSILCLQSDQETAMVLVQLFIFLIFGTKKNELLV